MEWEDLSHLEYVVIIIPAHVYVCTAPYTYKYMYTCVKMCISMILVTCGEHPLHPLQNSMVLSTIIFAESMSDVLP